MRYELSDYDCTAIKLMLLNKPRGVRRVNDPRMLNGIFWFLRSGAPWRDLSAADGPRTTCYNCFELLRWADVWFQIMEALAAGHDSAVQIIDTSVARVHQHRACVADKCPAPTIARLESPRLSFSGGSPRNPPEPPIRLFNPTCH